ncbi:putative holin-like toxin [Staphylococcus cornubiensis]|nr:putative holin-like toxin [Staphylococcus cornubiensis]
MMSIADALMIMIGFSSLTVSIIHLVVTINKKSQKNNHH